MALLRHPLTKEQIEEFAKHINSAYEIAKPSPLFYSLMKNAGKPLPDKIKFKFPWRVRLRRAWDKFLKWTGIREREIQTVGLHQIEVRVELKRQAGE